MLDPAELSQYVRERLRSTKAPSTIKILDELPYNETGKLLRRVVRDTMKEPTLPRVATMRHRSDERAACLRAYHGRRRRCGHVKRVRIRHFARAKEQGIKITGLTSYDYLTASVFDQAGIDFLLVGDSAGNTVFGRDTTLPVTVDETDPARPCRRAGLQAGARGGRHAVRLVRGRGRPRRCTPRSGS